MSGSFVERNIIVSIGLNGDTFDGALANALTLSGLRVQATIQTYGGSTGSYSSQAQLRIEGMQNADMAKLSTLGFQAGYYKRNWVTVQAGDSASGMAQIFQGSIFYGNVDYNSMPDVGLELSCSALADLQYATAQPNDFKGSVPVATMLQKICSQAGLTFANHGVTTSLTDQSLPGTYETQIETICHAAGICRSIKNGTLTIWPYGSYIDGTTVSVSPATGLVGYPRYIVSGVEVTTLFNPTFEVGRQVNLQSSTPAPDAQQAANLGNNGAVKVPGANGSFYCFAVTHNLSSQTINGPWSSDVSLSNTKFNAR